MGKANFTEEFAARPFGSSATRSFRSLSEAARWPRSPLAWGSANTRSTSGRSATRSLLRQRSLTVRYAKARRGELVVCASVGFVKADDSYEKGPDRRVQEAITLVFDMVEELGSARQALCWLHERDLALPVKRRDGDTGLRRPSYASIHRIIENPVYGGTCAYGKTSAAPTYSAEGFKVKTRRSERDEWLALKPGAHEGYVGWERFEAIRAMVAGSVPTCGHHGAPKHGDALLAGLIRCRRCGRKLTLRYTGATHGIPR